MGLVSRGASPGEASRRGARLGRLVLRRVASGEACGDRSSWTLSAVEGFKFSAGQVGDLSYLGRRGGRVKIGSLWANLLFSSLAAICGHRRI